jgi:hypothetical protein
MLPLETFIPYTYTLKLILLSKEVSAFSKKSWLFGIFLFAFTCLFFTAYLKNTKNTLQLLLLFCQTYEPFHSAHHGFNNLFYSKGTTINPIYLLVIARGSLVLCTPI